MTEIHFDFLNFNNILLLLVILVIGGYLYYEIHKMKLTMNDIDNKLKYLLDNHTNISLDNVIKQPEIIPQPEIIQPEIIPQPEITQSLNIQQSIQEQMDREDNDSDSESDSRSDSDSDSRSDDSESRISQSEIEKDYGKNEFERENNNASIDDILSDKHIITDNNLSDILNVDSDLTKIDEFIQNIKSDKEETTTKDMKDYNDMTVSELKKVLVDMKLPVSGNKTKLIERILGNKK